MSSFLSLLWEEDKDGAGAETGGAVEEEGKAEEEWPDGCSGLNASGEPCALLSGESADWLSPCGLLYMYMASGYM